MLRTYESFINYSLINRHNHHHQTKIQRKQTGNRVTLRSFFVVKSCSNGKLAVRDETAEKRISSAVKQKLHTFAAEKTNTAVNTNSAARLEIPRSAENCGP